MVNSGMSKVNTDEHLVFDDQKPLVKKLRFHPYYYQGRKGSYYNHSGKRVNIKIVKIEKNENELILTITGKFENKKVELRCPWSNLEFDYYSIRCLQDWKIRFAKK